MYKYRDTMAYDPTANYQEESTIHVGFGWAMQVLQLMQSITQYSILCGTGNWTHLRDYHQRLVALRDMLGAKFPKELANLDAEFEKAEEKLKVYERVALRHDLGSEIFRKKHGREIYEMERKIYNLLMKNMRNYGILEALRLDTQDVARRQWYGDAK